MEILIGNKFEPFKQGNLKIDNQQISGSSGSDFIPSNHTKYIVPGFIDRHTHGGYGIDFMDDNLEQLKYLLEKLPEEGITSVLATTTTKSYADIKAAIRNASAVKANGTKILGVHLEGPFLNLTKVGAQNPKYVVKADKTLFNEYLNNIKMISYAPEMTDVEFTSYLVNNQIKASCVHSNALKSELMLHKVKGLSSISHFYNGCSGFDHREPKIINFGLEEPDIEVELIVDGVHVDPSVIAFTNQVKPMDKIILITDSMRAKGMENGEYDIGGQMAIKNDVAVRLANGSLAGSVLKMNVAVKNFQKFTNSSYARSFYAASTAVAKSLNLTDVGIIKNGYYFDLVELDEDLNVLKTYVNGQVVYDRNKKT